MSAASAITVGLVGARGYTGGELVRLLEAHPRFRLAYASSRQAKGQTVAQMVEGAASALVVEDLSPEEAAARGADAVVLALPNGQSGPWVQALQAAARPPVVVDLSADHRFDDAWAYGLPERFRGRIAGARLISNPGCYATGMQLGIAPALELLSGPPVVFGVSGYSGAGTTPSDKNDPEKLRDNLLPYSLTGHVHEREVTRHLGREVFFSPHVAPFFRGITLTISMPLARPVTRAELLARYREVYAGERLVMVTEEAPLVRDVMGRHGCSVGGFAVDEAGRRAVVIATIDNLLKGAATQAVQNMNLAFGIDEHLGIPAHG